MGLPLSSLRLILREHKKDPFRGRVLTLGRMAVLATYEQVLTVFKEEGVIPADAELPKDRHTNIPSMKDGAGEERFFTSDQVFFKLLGVEKAEAMDISDYEKAEYLCDLNRPVPSELAGRFDAILDFGTIEHIFDVRQTLTNISRMLKPGGRILHCVGTTNRIGHGFYMFSPCLFYDYYLANQFADTRAYLVEGGRWNSSFEKKKLYEYAYNSNCDLETGFQSCRAISVFFVARKTKESTGDAVPIQHQFMDRFTASRQGVSASKSNAFKSYLKQQAPSFLRTWHRRWQIVKWRSQKQGMRDLGEI